MKTILSQIQFQNLLGLFESSNSGGRCMYCGCPDNFRIVKGIHLYKSSPHFQKCPEIKRLKDFNGTFRMVKGQMQFKDIVIDEVYECRWDCCTKSG